MDRTIDLEKLKHALDSHKAGFMPWNEEKQLFIDAAEAYLLIKTTAPYFDGEPFDFSNPMDYTDLRDFYIYHNGSKSNG